VIDPTAHRKNGVDRLPTEKPTEGVTCLQPTSTPSGATTTRFSTSEVFHSDRMKIVCGYFEPGQFIPVHAPDSDVAIIVRSGSGVVREGETDRSVGPGDVVVVPAGTARGVRRERRGAT